MANKSQRTGLKGVTCLYSERAGKAYVVEALFCVVALYNSYG